MKYRVYQGSKTKIKSNRYANTTNKKIEIDWARLVINNNSCPRCCETGSEIGIALEIMKELVKNVGIDIETRMHEITFDEFSKNPLVSNRIYISDEPIEEILGALVGSSKCCNECGDNDCRTLEINGKIYESISRKLIIKAVLKTMVDMI